MGAMRAPGPLAGEDRLPDGLAAALRREIAALLVLLDGAAKGSGVSALTPVRFRFASSGFADRTGRDREVVISIAFGGFETTERVVPAPGPDGAGDGR
jgi:hypothetical protein